jgi:hypothetical protein
MSLPVMTECWQTYRKYHLLNNPNVGMGNTVRGEAHAECTRNDRYLADLMRCQSIHVGTLNEDKEKCTSGWSL